MWMPAIASRGCEETAPSDGGIVKPQAGEAAEIGVGRAQVAAMLQGQGGQMDVVAELAGEAGPQLLDQRLVLQGAGQLVGLGQVETGSQGARGEAGAPLAVPRGEGRLLQACPQGVVDHLLEGLAGVEGLLAPLAQQHIIDRESGAQSIKMPPLRAP